MKTSIDEFMKSAVSSPEESLRERASQRLQIQQDPDISTLKPEEVKQLFHELQVHQIELELQNDELRRTQEALQDARESYIDLYDFAPVGYLAVSNTRLILKANLTAATLLGVPRTSMINQPLSRFILLEDQDSYYQHLNQLSAQYEASQESPSELQSCELRMVKKDQTVFWAQLSATVSTYSHGTPIFRVVLSDITRRKKAEEALRQSERSERENLFRKLFRQHCAVMLILDLRTGKIIDANNAAVLFYGWSLDELRQMTIQDINTLPPDTLRTFLLKASDSEACRYEFRHRRADGSIREVEVFSNDLERAGEKVLVSIVHDITERKQFEEQLQTLNNELERRVEERTRELQETQAQYLHAEKLSAIGKLSASIAHEVSNPLHAIMTILKGLKKHIVMDKKDRKLLELAIDESERIRNLMQSLRDFNRPSLGKKEVMDMHKSIDSLLLLCRKDFNMRQITVVCNYAEQLPQILAVQDQIKQVLLNLLTNAAEACLQAGGVITISTWVQEKWVAVEIKDTGVGIASDKMDQIFQPFYTTKAESKGTGLGLSVCHGIIQRHQGEIRFKSTVGEGSVFTVLLPAQIADPSL